MPELLGVISGGAGLLSLGLQLAETALALKRLRDGYKHAPETLSDMAEEIETLGLLMLHVEASFASDDALGAVAARCLNMCRTRCNNIQKLTNKLDAALRRSEAFGRLRTAMADKDIQQLLALLEGAKSSLVLACHVLSEYVELSEYIWCCIGKLILH